MSRDRPRTSVRLFLFRSRVRTALSLRSKARRDLQIFFRPHDFHRLPRSLWVDLVYDDPEHERAWHSQSARRFGCATRRTAREGFHAFCCGCGCVYRGCAARVFFHENVAGNFLHTGSRWIGAGLRSPVPQHCCSRAHGELSSAQNRMHESGGSVTSRVNRYSAQWQSIVSADNRTALTTKKALALTCIFFYHARH